MKPYLVIIAALTGAQAQALSCAAPDPVRAFQAAMAAPETYVVVSGTLALGTQEPVPDGPKDRARAVPVRFSGMVLTRDGFTQALQTPMTVQITCAGPWCGSMPDQTGRIYFAEVADGAYTLWLGPCGGSFTPTPQIEALLTSCIRGGACVPENGLD